MHAEQESITQLSIKAAIDSLVNNLETLHRIFYDTCVRECMSEEQRVKHALSLDNPTYKDIEHTEACSWQRQRSFKGYTEILTQINHLLGKYENELDCDTTQRMVDIYYLVEIKVSELKREGFSL